MARITPGRVAGGGYKHRQTIRHNYMAFDVAFRASFSTKVAHGA